MINEQRARAANERFYAAFNSQSLETMRDVWLDDVSSACVHPGWRTLQGFASIMESWSAIFENSGNMEVDVSDVSVAASEDLAWVSCLENVFTITPNGVQSSKVYATNIFRLVDGQWKMVLHHASHMPVSSR
jgi:ketosteroid isomerase-like protein